MNKIKWEQSPDYNLHIHSIIPFSNAISPVNVKVFWFSIGKETFFLFVNRTLMVITYNNNDKEQPFTLDSKYECNYLSSIETLIDIKQCARNQTNFVLCTSKGNLYSISFSPLDYYSQLKAMLPLRESSYKVLQYSNNQFIVLIKDSLYLYTISLDHGDSLYQFTKTILYKPNKKNEKILSASLLTSKILLFSTIIPMILVFTNQNIKLLNAEGNDIRIIYQYDSVKSYIGKIFGNKVYYIKGNDELSIYNFDNAKEESSIKFSSKKMFNKISFDRVIEVNEDLILIVNESKCELYTYSFKYHVFNRETTLFDNKDYFYNNEHQLVFALGFDYRQMIIKTKFGVFEINKGLLSSTIIPKGEVSNKSDDLFNDIELGEFERQYEESLLIEVKKQKAIDNRKRSIAILIKQINANNYNEKKLEVTLALLSIYDIDKTAIDNQFEMEIYCDITKCFIELFGCYSLTINWSKINLQYIINTVIERTQMMLVMTLNNYDKNSYVKVYYYLKKLLQINN